jgi:hypothetical protein
MKFFENFLCGIMPTDFAYSSSFPRYKGVKMPKMLNFISGQILIGFSL